VVTGFDLEPTDVQCAGSVAYAVTRHRVAWRAAGADTTTHTTRGHGLVVLRRQPDEAWRIARYAWTDQR
jgi:ketosteroid isomerase-like protein